MAATVRERLCDLVIERLTAIEGVAQVIPDGAGFEAYAEAVRDGAVIDVAFGDDIRIDDAPLNMEVFELDVICLVHLPDPSPPDRELHQEASEWHRRISEIHSKRSEPDLSQWHDGEPPAALAIDTRTLGGGGAWVSEFGTHVTVSAFTITYRHLHGDMETAA